MTTLLKTFKSFLQRILPLPILSFLEYLRRRVNVLIVRLKLLLHIPLKKKQKMLRFEIHLAEHCNLNCKACNNFSPIAEHELVDVEEFRNDFMRLGELFNHKCERIYLLGGEPLLHPEINTLMAIARENFSEGYICVFSNGILLPKMNDTFWETCRDNHISIIVTPYPINIDVNRIKELAQKFGVDFKWAWGRKEHSSDVFIIRPINPAGDSNAKVNFGTCGRALDCVTLSHGRLFTCSLVPNYKHFNKKFGLDLKTTEADYINIYDDVTANEILTRLAEPIPACRYCNLDGRIIHWGISKKEISEWV